MATNAKIVYNFNENDASTIRDYSENGNDGTATNITIQASTRVGNDAVFNSTTDQISLGNITDLNGQAEMALHLGFNPQAGAGTLKILTKSSQIEITYNYATTTLTASLYVASGTATVAAPLTIGTFYDVDLVWVGDELTLTADNGIDKAASATDSSKSGVIDTNANVMYLGDTGGSDSANFLLNEFKLYDEAITADIIAAVIAEQNGVLSSSSLLGGFAVGDVVGGQLFDVPMYGIITWVGTGADFRVIPLTDNFRTGMQVARVGHLWDTARQFELKIDNTPEICFYDLVTKSSEVLTAAKKTLCLTKNGIVNKSVTKTTTYTIVDSDHTIYGDTSGGTFTLTLPSSPITDKEYLIIKTTTDANKLTISGNGKNINGSSTIDLLSGYDAMQIKYNGTAWFVK